MSDFLEQALGAIERVEVQVKPREASSHAAQGNLQGLLLLSNLAETKRVLLLEGHREPVRRELFRAVTHIEVSLKEWWSQDEHVLPKWREHFLEFLLAVRWWTMVAALQAGHDQRLTSSLFLEPKPASSTYERDFPSYALEKWLQSPEGRTLNIFGGDLDESQANAVLEGITHDAGLFVEGTPTRFVEESESPLIEEEVTVNLTRDVLGVSRTWSWVIRTKCQGVECALKRVDDDHGGCDQPVIARLSHPHIVRLMRYWRNDDALFLMMELMEGDLTDLLASWVKKAEPQGSLLSLLVAVDILLQTAKAMLYLHDLNILYPHLNCSNVLFRTSEALNHDREYVVKLSGGRYCLEDGRKRSDDVYRFGLFCLEFLTGSWQGYEDDLLADTSVPEGIPPILKFCIASCFEGSIQFGFVQVVTLLLLAQCQVLNSQKDIEAFVKFGNEENETMHLEKPDSGFASSTNVNQLEKYPINQLYPEPDVSYSNTNPPATLVFFHGFAKSHDEWKSTWMTRNGEHVWPKAWLPKDLLPENVCILSLSYDNDDTFEETEEFHANDIGKDALRQLIHSSKWNLADPEAKVVLIGHSFGGLIIKSLVVEASHYIQSVIPPTADEKLVKNCRIFMENLRGIVFYSVPGSSGHEDKHFEDYIDKLNQTGLLQRSSLM